MRSTSSVSVYGRFFNHRNVCSWRKAAFGTPATIVRWFVIVTGALMTVVYAVKYWM